MKSTFTRIVLLAMLLLQVWPRKLKISPHAQ